MRSCAREGDKIHHHTREGRNALESREEGDGGGARRPEPLAADSAQAMPPPATRGNRQPRHPGNAGASPQGGGGKGRETTFAPSAHRSPSGWTRHRASGRQLQLHRAHARPNHDRRPGSGPGQPESRSGGAGPPTPRLVSLETTPSPSLQGSPPGWTRQRASAQTLDRPWGRCVARRSCRATVRFVTRNSRPLNSGGFSRRSSYRSLQGRSSSTG